MKTNTLVCLSSREKCLFFESSMDQCSGVGVAGARVEHVVVGRGVDLDALEAAVETRVGQVEVDGGLVDAHVAGAHGVQRLAHVRVAPRHRRVLAQLDALAFAAAVQSAGRNAEFGGRLLHGGAATNRLERARQVVRVPGGGRRVERRRQLDALLARDLVERAARDAVLLGRAVRRDAAGAQLAQRYLQVRFAPRLRLVGQKISFSQQNN